MESCRQQMRTIDEANRSEVGQLKSTLNEQLPTKVKESYQLLNLREMEHHMSKQKKYPSPHAASPRRTSSRARSACCTSRNWRPGTRTGRPRSSRRWAT